MLYFCAALYLFMQKTVNIINKFLFRSMKRFFLFLCAALTTLQLLAVPAMPGKRIFVNPDGTTVEYEVRGDEFYHFMADESNNMLEVNTDGFLVAKEQISQTTVTAKRAASPVAEAYKARQAGTINLAPRGLFILVNFSDKSFNSSNTLSAMTQMISSVGHTYSYNGATGSMLDYFIDQSGDQYHPQFDVYGPVTVSSTSSYYAGSDGTTYAYKMVIEACQALDNQVNFSNYDNNGDGYVDFIYVIYAGKGQADGGGSGTIWPHAYNVSYKQTVTLDGVKLGSYACGAELNGSSGVRNGIGTMCHEFSHVLGLPDYYDTDYGTNYSNNATPGKWHIMDQGSYNNNQNTPPNYAAHDKYFFGWYTPTILEEPENVIIPADGQTYRMINEAQTLQSAKSTNPIYYLENRQKSGWDAYLPGHGMLVWKVTYNSSKWSSNSPNNTAGTLNYALISASGNTSIGYSRDPFPGSTNVTSYTPITGNALTEIEEANGDISFKFNGGITRAYKVTFNAGSHASCATTSLTQSSIGASITLPNVTNVAEHYRFLGWSKNEGAQSAECGTAGENYVPKRDLTLYAVVVPDGYLVTFDTETYQTEIGHGVCAVEELRESGTGAGIVLPEFTADQGYAFQNWVSLHGNYLYNAGYTGDMFYPTQDTTLYPYVYPSDSIRLYYDLTGVDITSGPSYDVTRYNYCWIKAADGYTATFTAAEAYNALTAANTTVSVSVYGEPLAITPSYSNGTLTISIPASQLTGRLDISITATINPNWNCSSYSYTYTANQGIGNSVALGTYTWKITGTGTTTGGYNNGQRFGGNRSKCNSMTYETSNTANCLINSITVNAWCTRSGGTLEAFINDESLGTATLTAATANYSFSNPDNLQGNVKFTITNATSGQSYYIYVKSINITMADFPDGTMAPGDPIKVNVDYLAAGYYDYNEGVGEPLYVWQPTLVNTNGLQSMGYPRVIALYLAESKTSISGTHYPAVALRQPSANEASYADTDKDCIFTFTYKSESDYNGLYIYHVDAQWTEEDGQPYYIDADVYGYLSDWDTEDGDDIIPTGDTNPKYYQVKHWLQKVDGGSEHNAANYDLDQTDSGQGGEGETFSTYAYSYTGFISPADQPVTLQAGNTQANPALVEYFYDRRTYPVNFVVNGLTTQSETLRYGVTPTYNLPDPTKQPDDQYSYAFSGWSPTLRPVRQADTYTAQFNAVPWVIVYFDANDHGTAPDSIKVSQGQTITNPGNLTATGYTFGGWFTEKGCVNAWNFSNPVNATMTLYAKWTANKHNLRWNSNGGTLSGNCTGGKDEYVQVEYGTPITAPTATRTGYTHTGWGAIVPATMPDNALEFTAQWQARTDIAYTVKHYKEALDGSWTLAETENFNNGTTGASVTLGRKTYTGFGQPAAQTVTIDGTGTQTFSYQYPRMSYTLTWDGNGGTVNGNATISSSVKFEAAISAPNNVVRTGYNFTVWSPTPATTMPAANTTYTAQWQKKTYSISVIAGEHGSASISPVKDPYEYGDVVTISASAEQGYHFSGWNDGNSNAERTLTVGTDITAASTTFTASFAPNTNTPYIVHHMQQNITDNGWTEQLPVDNQTGTTGALTTAVAFNYPGFDPQLPIEQKTVAADGSTEVYVYYIRKTYQIRFLVDGVEKQSEDLRYEANPVYDEATNGVPVRAATAQYTYTFDGWDPEISIVTKAQDYNAKFRSTVNTYTVSFNKQGHGNNTANQEIAYGGKVTEPDALSETGWTFGGWFTEAGDEWDFDNDVVEGDLELFAMWTINTHRLSWDANQGTITSAAGTYTEGNAIEFGTDIVAPNVERAGYHFDGWSPALVATMPDYDLDFQAQWSAQASNYKVRHLQQNIYDDDFTQYAEQTLSGTTDQPTEAVANSYPGFTAQAFDQANIKGDGSTVIEIRYIRNKHALTWSENGGDALTGDYTQGNAIKFGTPITAPNTPTKTGWVFNGWNPAVPATMPDNVLSISATWRKDGNTPYTVKHFFQKLDGTYPDEPDFIENLKGETDSEVTPGVKDSVGFTAPDPVTVTILEDGSRVVIYKYTRNKHSIRWEANGGDLGGSFSNGEVFYGDVITAPNPVTRTGYDFTGWYPADIPATMPDEDLLFTAQWQALKVAYRIEHKQQNVNDNDFTLFEAEDLQGFADAIINPAVKNYTGFTAPTPQTNVKIKPDGSLVVVYEYTRNSYELTWNANGGILVDNGYTRGQVKYDAPITRPDDPTREGYTFGGWDKDIPTEMPADNLTLNAQWSIISFSDVIIRSDNTNEGQVSVNPDQDRYNYGESVEIEATAEEGYHFTGWSDGSDDANRTIVITSDTTITATFAPNTDTQYTIRHLKEALNGDWEQDGADDVRHDGVTGEMKTVDPNTYDGFKTPNAQRLEIKADGSTLFEYKYKRNVYLLVWDANGGELSNGSALSQDSVKFDADIAVPAEPTWTGHNFKGWNIDPVPAKMPSHDLTIKATWELEVYDNVDFKSGDSEMGYVTVDPDKDEYSYGEEVTITATANDGYTFEGWVDEDGNVISTDATTVVTVDANTGTVTATFSANEDTKYVIRHLLQNIDDDNFAILYSEEEKQGTTGAEVSPEPIVIPGFDTPNPQTAVIKGDGSTVIIFNYLRKSFNLEWDANGGQLLDNGRTEGQVRFGKPIVAAEVEWIGHIFQGWLPAEIPDSMPANDLTFVAQWEKVQVTGVTFGSNDETAGTVTVEPGKETYEYGDEVTITATANDGYSFSGWSDGSQDGNPRTITIDGDTTITAIFTANEGILTLRVLLQNIEDDEFSVESEVETSAKTGDVIEPAEIEGFTAPAAQTATIILNENNVLELRYLRNSYNLAWDANGGVLAEGEFTQGLVKFGAAIIAPADPIREGFNFLGWEPALEAKMPANDLTFVAQWEEAQGIEIVVDGRTILSNDEIRIYDFNGRDVTGLNGHLSNGMYIIVGGGSAVKIAIQ